MATPFYVLFHITFYYAFCGGIIDFKFIAANRMPFTVRFNFAVKFNRLAIYRILPPIAVLKIVDFFIKFVFLKSFKCRSLFGVSPFNVSLARIHFAFGGVYDFADRVGLSEA